MTATSHPDDRRRARRSARRAANRAEILDAAEVTFARDGLHKATIRAIAAEAGFSPAAVYLFFENRQHLLAETLTRRGDELNGIIAVAIAEAADPIDALHAVIDRTLDFFARRESFLQMLRELRGGSSVIGPALAEYEHDVDERLVRAQDLLSRVVAAGQAAGSIRPGAPSALAHLYMVLVNEFVYLRALSTADLAVDEFHAMVDGALRTSPG